MNARSPLRQAWFWMPLVLLLSAVILLRRSPPRVPDANARPQSPKSAVETSSIQLASADAPGGAPAFHQPANEFLKRPFAVARESEHYQWTSENGKDPRVMQRLAHNETELARMAKENDTIFRRQLVYHKGAFSLQAQAERSGQPVSQVTLPGLDGQELDVEIVKTECEAGGDRGTFTGRLAGRDDSLVIVAFVGGAEGFTVVSPRDKLYLHAEPREPGELVVKSIDPATYATLPAGCGIR